MIDGRRSGTAERVAIRRAAHALCDRPLLFEDPLSMRILSEEGAAQAREEAANPEQHSWVRGLRIFVAARSRFAEEELMQAYDQGVRQYVVLGAGLDTFAYRNPLADLRVFEVDHPDTQAWKGERLRHAGIEIPASMRFAPVDFERDTLAHGLEAAGFRRDEPAFFSWLGVVPYLTRDAALATLRFIGGLSERSGVVFDYAIPRQSMGEAERLAFDALAERVARAGEPFRLFFEPEHLAAELSGLGFTKIVDMDGAAMRARWLGDNADGPRPHGRSGRLLCAWV
jgi:methyltransferase (TIGR00027 family)